MGPQRVLKSKQIAFLLHSFGHVDRLTGIVLSYSGTGWQKFLHLHQVGFQVTLGQPYSNTLNGQRTHRPKKSSSIFRRKDLEVTHICHLCSYFTGWSTVNWQSKCKEYWEIQLLSRTSFPSDDYSI